MYNNQALDLPEDFATLDLAELGRWLNVAGSKQNTYDTRIFPWDSSSSFYVQPIPVPESPSQCRT